MTLVCYVLHLVGAIAALPSIAGLVLNYLKRHDAQVVVQTHHRWMIRSFWWAVLWIVIGAVTYYLVIGLVILGLTWLWYVYRHLRGLLNLLSGATMPV